MISIIRFGLGFVGAWLLSFIFGEQVISGLNNLLDTSRFTVEALPVLGGTLAWLGGYFKSININNEK